MMVRATGVGKTATALPAWDDVRRTVHAGATALPPLLVPLARAAGTVLAEPLWAGVALPSADVAAMDGYAVAGESPWRIVRRVLAGGDPGPRLVAGCACEIATGARVPDGTDAVLPHEDAQVLGQLVSGVTTNRHVRTIGEECAAGEELLPAGTRVSAAVLGLASAVGHDHLLVRPRPRVAAVVTGDEVATEGRPRPGQVRDAIGPMLADLVWAAGGKPVGLRHVADDRTALIDALGVDADVVLVSGASAAGPADHLHSALRAAGASVLVDGVACRPGRPQTVSELPDGRFVIGLPGNPLAALVAFHTVAATLLLGLRNESMRPLRSTLRCTPLLRHPRDTRLVPVSSAGRCAVPIPHAGAAMLRGAALADGFAVIGPGIGSVTEVELLPLLTNT